MHTVTVLCIINLAVGCFSTPSANADATPEAEPQQIFRLGAGPRPSASVQPQPQAQPQPWPYPMPMPMAMPMPYPSAALQPVPDITPEPSGSDMFLDILTAIIKGMMAVVMPVMTNLLVDGDDQPPIMLLAL